MDEVLSRIGIEGDDTLEEVLSKINFALRMSDALIMETAADPKFLRASDDIASLAEGEFPPKGEPVKLYEARSYKKLMEFFGIDTSKIDWDKETAFMPQQWREHAQQQELKKIREGLALILKWLNGGE